MTAWSNEVFAKNLKYYMDKSGKSQREMAEIIGVSAPTFNDYLKAKKYPRIDKIERMADYFGILKSLLLRSMNRYLVKTNFKIKYASCSQLCGLYSVPVR